MTEKEQITLCQEYAKEHELNGRSYRRFMSGVKFANQHPLTDSSSFLEWIPCDEQLPIQPIDEDGEYEFFSEVVLTLTNNGRVQLERYDFLNHDWEYRLHDGDVIGWMSVPFSLQLKPKCHV